MSECTAVLIVLIWLCSIIWTALITAWVVGERYRHEAQTAVERAQRYFEQQA